MTPSRGRSPRCHRPHPAVSPGQHLPYGLVELSRNVSAFEDHMLLAVGRRSQQLEVRLLRGLHRQAEVVPARDQQHRKLDARKVMLALKFGRPLDTMQSGAEHHRSPEARLERKRERTYAGAETQAVEGDALAVDVVPADEVVDGAADVLRPLHEQLPPVVVAPYRGHSP